MSKLIMEGDTIMPGCSNLLRLLGTLTSVLVLCLTGCGHPSAVPEARSGASGDRSLRDVQAGIGSRTQEQGSLFGPGGLLGSKDEKADGRGAEVAVNSYLWRASLDTINFIPLVSADAFSGVIISDWYTPVETPNERMKVQVNILDRELRADGVRVSVFKQRTAPKGSNWADVQVDPRTQTDVENAILTRARQLRAAGGS